MQARKIRSHLTQLGVTPPVGSESAVDSIPATTPQAAPPLQQCAEQEQRAAETETPPCFQPEDLQQYQQLTKAVANLEGLQVSETWVRCSAWQAGRQACRSSAAGGAPCESLKRV